MKNAFIVLGICCVAVLALPPAAIAAPCCESCDGWLDGEPPLELDYCWEHCVICGGGGPRCGSDTQCASACWACIGGYCVFVGGCAAPTPDWTSDPVWIVSNDCSDVETLEKSEPIDAEAETEDPTAPPAPAEMTATDTFAT